MLFTARYEMAVRSRFILWSIALMLLLVGAAQRGEAGLAVESNDVLTFEYQQVGANEEEAVRLACIRGVHATLGRLLFSDYSLQARELLEPYLQKNWPKFVASYYVLERRVERDGFGARIRVQTYPEVLHRDLREKKFLYLPRPNPYHYIFLAETVDGRRSDEGVARQAAIATLVQEGMKVFESGVKIPPDNTDVTVDAERFSAAREAATRIGAEIILSGRVETKKIEQREVFFDVIYTYESRVHLEMIRTDDGTRIGAVDVVERASETDAEVALETAVRSATQEAILRILQRTRGIWRSTILEQAKFQLMFTDLTPVEVQDIISHLESVLGYRTRVRLKSFYGGVAIFTVDTLRNFPALERAILAFRSFDLRITDRQGNRITVDVHH